MQIIKHIIKQIEIMSKNISNSENACGWLGTF